MREGGGGGGGRRDEEEGKEEKKKEGKVRRGRSEGEGGRKGRAIMEASCNAY